MISRAPPGSSGIGGTGRALDIALIAPGRGAKPGGPARRLAAAAFGAHPGAAATAAEGGIAAALATGDQGGIPEDDAEAMRRSGLAHLLSVSGLHLTAVVGAVMLLTLKLLALSPALALRFRLVLVAAGGRRAGRASPIPCSPAPRCRRCAPASPRCWSSPGSRSAARR